MQKLSSSNGNVSQKNLSDFVKFNSEDAMKSASIQASAIVSSMVNEIVEEYDSNSRSLA
ncbi:MAG: hypothetical protein MJ229_06690 [bacterium]|nr:hypothetical protein [bacterium]